MFGQVSAGERTTQGPGSLLLLASSACSLAWILLFIVAIFLHRVRGLWLLMERLPHCSGQR